MRAEPTGLSWLTLGSQPRVVGSPGGIVLPLRAGAPINVGQDVEIQPDLQVFPAGQGTNGIPLGVAVGGKSTRYTCTVTASAVGSRAAEVGQQVLVCVLGTAFRGADSSSAVKDIIGGFNGRQQFDITRFGALDTPMGGGVYDAGEALNLAVAAALPTHGIIHIPAGYDFWTDQSILYQGGTQISGDSNYQYGRGFNVDPKGSKIHFEPPADADLFSPTGPTHSDFRFHISIRSLYLVGENSHARAAIAAAGVIYSSFEHLVVDKFKRSMKMTQTINNSIEKCLFSGSEQAVLYSGKSETTDTYDKCTFTAAYDGTPTPVGVVFPSVSWSIRFIAPIFENLQRAMDIAANTHGIEVALGYAENVTNALVDTDENGVFQIGVNDPVVDGDGDTIVPNTNPTDTHLHLLGGKYFGSDAGALGSVLRGDHCNSVIALGTYFRNYKRFFKSTPNCRPYGCQTPGVTGQWTVEFTNDPTKIGGVYPAEPLGDTHSIYAPRANFSKLNLTNLPTAAGSEPYGEVYVDSGTLKGVL